jgi:hypothetical protein
MILRSAYTILFLSIFGLLSVEATSCDLNGKTIIVDFAICPDKITGGFRKDSMAHRCIRTRKRLTIIGSKVALHYSETTNEGELYTIGEKFEVSKDDETYKRIFSQPLPYLNRRAWLSASYSVGQLRLLKEAEGRLKEDGEPFNGSSSSYLFEISSDCKTCRLSQVNYYSYINYKPRRLLSERTMHLSKQNHCDIRVGF